MFLKKNSWVYYFPVLNEKNVFQYDSFVLFKRALNVQSCMAQSPPTRPHTCLAFSLTLSPPSSFPLLPSLELR